MKGSQAAEPKGHSENAEFSKRDRFDASELPERRAIALAQRGDPSAFERLYQLHSARVYALCLRMTGNTAEAEDLMQDVFLMVFCKIHTFRGDSAFSTWLHRIAVNLTLMRLRKKHSLGTSLQENSDPQNDRPDHREELAVADPLLTGSLDRLHLHRAMQKLCPSQILVVVLHDLQGYKHTEIANMLDWSIGNSKSHLHRARARLRKLLEGGQRFDGITHSRTAQAAFGA
jgi:RNA polymerase sigma-70 factor (ECF subfamily)